MLSQEVVVVVVVVVMVLSGWRGLSEEGRAAGYEQMAQLRVMR